MDIVELLKVLSVPGLKVTFEYNVDYDCQVITASIDGIERKMIMAVRDCEYIEYPSVRFMKDLRGMVNGVRNRYKEVCRNGGY